MGILFIDHDNAGRNPCAVKQIGRQADDAFDVSSPNDVPSNLRFGISSEQNPVGKNACPLALALQRADDVQ